MDRIWQWAWDRYGAKYSWAICAIGFPFLLLIYLVTAAGSRRIQDGILGAVLGAGIQLISVHSFVEAALRPARVAIAGDTGIGDSLPRARPTFVAWSDMSMLAAVFTFGVAGAWVAAVFERVSEVPVLTVVIGCAMTLGFAVPMT